MFLLPRSGARHEAQSGACKARDISLQCCATVAPASIHTSVAVCQVPYAWRKKTSLTGVYGLSSFTYCGVGAYLLHLLRRFPSKALPGSHVEAYFFLWQGLTSYMCDVYDLGQPSWSHPIDRITATSFICAEAARYLSFIGRWPLAGTLFLPPAFAASLWTFTKSVQAVDEKDAQAESLTISPPLCCTRIHSHASTERVFSIPRAGLLFLARRLASRVRGTELEPKLEPNPDAARR